MSPNAFGLGMMAIALAAAPVTAERPITRMEETVPHDTDRDMQTRPKHRCPLPPPRTWTIASNLQQGAARLTTWESGNGATESSGQRSAGSPRPTRATRTAVVRCQSPWMGPPDSSPTPGPREPRMPPSRAVHHLHIKQDKWGGAAKFGRLLPASTGNEAVRVGHGCRVLTFQKPHRWYSAQLAWMLRRSLAMLAASRRKRGRVMS